MCVKNNADFFFHHTIVWKYNDITRGVAAGVGETLQNVLNVPTSQMFW